MKPFTLLIIVFIIFSIYLVVERFTFFNLKPINYIESNLSIEDLANQCKIENGDSEVLTIIENNGINYAKCGMTNYKINH